LFHRGADGSEDLAVDVYGEFLVAHSFSEPDALRDARVLDTLHALGPTGIYAKRHLRQKNELGDARDSTYAPNEPARGKAAPDELLVREHGLTFTVRLGEGLRTGLFLDQRDNRLRVRELAQDQRVLNLFAYTGGFSVAALAGGATHVLSVDASRAALAWAERNAAGTPLAAHHAALCSDVFDALTRLGKQGERFDLVVVDPPSYSKTRSRRFVLEKHYAELCRASVALLAPGGSMLCCLNHHGVSRRKLRQMAQQGVRDAGRTVVRARELPAQLDFPAAPGAEPEMKSLLLHCD
jgi:23S rRNA (cytosine1962-C5)-methyltransferase